MAIVVLEEMLGGLDEVQEALDQAITVLTDLVEECDPALVPHLPEVLDRTLLQPALHKKSGQKSDSAVNKDFLASFWRLFKTKKSLFGRKKHRQGTLFVQSQCSP